MADYFNHRFMRMHQKLTDVVFDNIEKHIDCMISGEITISNQNSNKVEQTQGHTNEVKPCSQTELDSSGRMYNDNVATSKDSEAYVARQPLFYGKPNLQAAKVTASQQSNQPIQRTIRDGPFNLKGGGMLFFLKKKILISNVAEKNILILVEEKIIKIHL